MRDVPIMGNRVINEGCFVFSLKKNIENIIKPKPNIPTFFSCVDKKFFFE